MSILSILLSHVLGSHIHPPFRRSMPSSIKHTPGTFPLGTRLCVQCRHMCHAVSTPGPGGVTPSSSIGFLDWPHIPTLVFSVHFVLTRAHPVPTFRSVTHPRIALSQARLTLEFFLNELPKKKLQLVGMGFPINPNEPCARVSQLGRNIQEYSS